MRYQVFLPVFLVLTAACDVVDPDVETQLGTVFAFNQPSAALIPDTVLAGVPFTIDLRTFGDSCVTFTRTEIETDGNVVEIRPYDRIDTSDPCDGVMRTINHAVTLHFPVTETVTIRVIGRRAPGGQEERLEKRVVVR